MKRTLQRNRIWYLTAGVLVQSALLGFAASWLFLEQGIHPKASTALHPTPSAVVMRTPGPTPTPPPLPPGARLSIPAIGVNAPIETVGTRSNGDMAVPSQNPWDGVGWYGYGPQPGQPGSAVIDGHLDRPSGAPAVFWNLHQLHPGDAVVVTQANGTQLTFQVQASPRILRPACP